MSLEDCLPAELQGATTTITPLGPRPSGAGVYRVEAAGQAYILKISGEDEPLEAWRRKRRIQKLAAEAGVTPGIIHVDETRRAVVTPLIVDRSFPVFYRTPATHAAALALLGQTLRQVHEIPLPADATGRDPIQYLGELWAGLEPSFSLPPFVGDLVRGMLAEKEPPREKAPVLSHNDVNPGNVVYDGEKVLLVDWEVAGPNDPCYDLATASLFLRMDNVTCLGLLSAHEGVVVSELPARFSYYRRLVAVLCGMMFLHLARQGGHPGAADTETLESMPSLMDCYLRLRSGTLDLGTADGQWWFGMGLLKERAGL